MLLVDDEPRLRREARQAGAAAYLVKGCRASDLVEEITKAAGPMPRPPARSRAWWAYLDGQVTLEVADDGTGFVTTKAADPIAGHLGLNHFGLASMRQQLEMAGGSWQVHSRPGNGTTVTATPPLALN